MDRFHRFMDSQLFYSVSYRILFKVFLPIYYFYFIPFIFKPATVYYYYYSYYCYLHLFVCFVQGELKFCSIYLYLQIYKTFSL